MEDLIREPVELIDQDLDEVAGGTWYFFRQTLNNQDSNQGNQAQIQNNNIDSNQGFQGVHF